VAIQATISDRINSRFATNIFLAFTAVATAPTGLGKVTAGILAKPCDIISVIIEVLAVIIPLEVVLEILELASSLNLLIPDSRYNCLIPILAFCGCK